MPLLIDRCGGTFCLDGVTHPLKALAVE